MSPLQAIRNLLAPVEVCELPLTYADDAPDIAIEVGDAVTVWDNVRQCHHLAVVTQPTYYNEVDDAEWLRVKFAASGIELWVRLCECELTWKSRTFTVEEFSAAVTKTTA